MLVTPRVEPRRFRSSPSPTNSRASGMGEAGAGLAHHAGSVDGTREAWDYSGGVRSASRRPTGNLPQFHLADLFYDLTPSSGRMFLIGEGL